VKRKRALKIQPGDRVLCQIFNPVTGGFGRPFEGVIEDTEGLMYLVRPRGRGYLEPLQRKEIKVVKGIGWG
jgi:hypothetical protein